MHGIIRPSVGWVVQLNNGEKITGGPSWKPFSEIHLPETGATDWARLMARCDKDGGRLRIEKMAININGLWAEAPRGRAAYGYFESYQGAARATFKGMTPIGMPTHSPYLVSLGIAYTSHDERGLHLRVERYIVNNKTGNVDELEVRRNVNWLPCLIGTQDDEFGKGKIHDIAPRKKR